MSAAVIRTPSSNTNIVIEKNKGNHDRDNPDGGNQVGIASARSKISCDWYQGCFPVDQFFSICNMLRKFTGSAMQVQKHIPKAMACYRKAYSFGQGITIYRDNVYHATGCLVLTGVANPTNYLPLLVHLSAHGVRPTRIDLAFDDRRGVLSIADVYQAVKRQEAVTRWAKARLLEDVKLYSGYTVSQGLMFGSRASSSSLTIYDKGLESGECDSGEWNRWELHLADDQAESFVSDVIASVNIDKSVKKIDEILYYDQDIYPVWESDLPTHVVTRFKEKALAEIKKRLDFRDRQGVTNISRSPSLRWWEEFLEYFDPAWEEIKKSTLIPDWEDLQEHLGKERGAYNQAEKIVREVCDTELKPRYKPLSIAEKVHKMLHPNEDQETLTESKRVDPSETLISHDSPQVIQLLFPTQMESTLHDGIKPSVAQIIHFPASRQNE